MLAVDVVGERVGALERLGEGDAEQEGEQDLGAGLGQPQLLEELQPLSVQPLARLLLVPGVPGGTLVVRHLDKVPGQKPEEGRTPGGCTALSLFSS